MSSMENIAWGEEVEPNTYCYRGAAECNICGQECVHYQHVFYGIPTVKVRIESNAKGFVLSLMNEENIIAQHLHTCTKMLNMVVTPIEEGSEDFATWDEELGW